MPTAINGFTTALVSVLEGTVLYYVLKGFVDAGVVDPFWLYIYLVANFLIIFFLVHTSKYWGTLYLLGWWSGFGIMWYYAGLVETWEFALTSGILIFTLITRFFRHFDYD
jgi:hypothetical protein